jgi:hypothetical protein
MEPLGDLSGALMPLLCPATAGAAKMPRVNLKTDARTPTFIVKLKLPLRITAKYQH